MSDAIQASVDDQAFAVDFSGVEERSFEPLPRGRYDLRVVAAEIRQTDPSKAPYLALTYAVESGEGGPLEGERKLWENMSFSPKALWKLKGFLKAVGMTDEELAGTLQLNAEDLLDAMVSALVVVEKGQDGEPRNNVKRHFRYAFEPSAADIEQAVKENTVHAQEEAS